jgi:FkbH-like protein
LTTRRYTEAEVEAVAASPDYIARCFRLRDRFGDNGIISVVIAARQDDAWSIETWLMSCRVLGRKVEHAVLAELARAARSLGGKTLVGHYLPTAKNALVKNHYRDLGFRDTDQRWTLDLDSFAPALLPIELIHD